MSFVRRLTATALIVCVTTANAGVAQAQSVPTAPPQTSQPAPSNDTMAAGLLDGEMLAESHPTGGKLGVGLGIGVLTGILGTGIGYFVIGPDPLSAEALQRSLGKGPDYQLGLRTAWERKTKAKKRSAFLAGGLLGTAAFIALYAAASSNAQ